MRRPPPAMPSRPHFLGITLTGVDASTPPNAMQALLPSAQVELAFLYAHDHPGPRFVSAAWLRRHLPGLRGRLALHVCGAAARQALRDGALADLMPYLDRVQVNGPVAVAELPGLLARVPALITQHDPANAPLAQVEAPRHALLVDASGGRGVLPSCWVRPLTRKPVGFAGGLGLDNLPAQIHAISAVAQGPWWIDLESGLRDASDRFDPLLASRTARWVSEWAGAPAVR